MHRRSRTAKLGVLIATALVAAAGALTSPARSASPSSGTLSQENPEVRWEGTVTAQWGGTISGAGCQLLVPDPTCDAFELTVGELAEPSEPTKPGNGHGHGHGHGHTKQHEREEPAPAADDLQISVAAATSAAGQIVELDVYLYDADGNEVARDVELGRAELLVHEIPAGVYTVAVQSILSTDPTSAYRAVARAVDAGTFVEVDPETSCGLEGAPGGPPPDVVGVNGIIGDPTAAADGIDLGQPVSLDVLVFLDGVPVERATEIFRLAARSYEPLNVQLRAAEFRTHSFATDDAMALIREAKALLGGVRPAGIDIVEVLTAKNIQLLNQSAVAGLADCIGGVAHDDRAFLVAEANIAENIGIGPLIFDVDASANVTGHEIGHLMGGQHHYANCVEGVQPTDVRDDGAVEVSPCTLMFNAVDFLGPNFDTVNGLIVRGHATRYAS